MNFCPKHYIRPTCNRWTLLLFMALATSLVGCGRSAKDYSQFAKAGTTYASAMDDLLVATRNSEINTNSEILLNLASLQQPVTSTEYMTITASENQTKDVLDRLRKHTRLMGDYFNAMYEVATSDAPDQASDTAKGLADSLNSVGTELRGKAQAKTGTGQLLTDNQVTAIGTISRLYVTARIRTALKNALSRDNQTIRIELQTQDELLQALSKRLKNDLTDQRNQQEQRLIYEPLANPTVLLNSRSQQSAFIADRLRISNAESTAEELDAASGASKKLKAAYEDLINGTLSTARANDVLSDLDSLLAFAKAARTLSGGQS